MGIFRLDVLGELERDPETTNGKASLWSVDKDGVEIIKMNIYTGFKARKYERVIER